MYACSLSKGLIGDDSMLSRNSLPAWCPSRVAWSALLGQWLSLWGPFTDAMHLFEGCTDGSYNETAGTAGHAICWGLLPPSCSQHILLTEDTCSQHCFQIHIMHDYHFAVALRHRQHQTIKLWSGMAILSFGAI